MPRTVVPDKTTEPLLQPRSGFSRRFRARLAGEGEGDDYLTKLAKYAPAEATAIFVPASALAGDRMWWVLLALIVSAFIGVGALIVAARKAEAGKAPYPHFYWLSMFAFLCWALGINSAIQAFLSVPAELAGFPLLLAAGTIPMVDTLLNPGAAKRRQGALEHVKLLDDAADK